MNLKKSKIRLKNTVNKNNHKNTKTNSKKKMTIKMNKNKNSSQKKKTYKINNLMKCINLSNPKNLKKHHYSLLMLTWVQMNRKELLFTKVTPRSFYQHNSARKMT